MKIIISFITLCTLLTVPISASAINIPINPGALGSYFQKSTIPFDELNGTVFSNQSLMINFEFTDMKSLQLAFSDNTPTEYFFTTQLVLMHGGGFLGLPSGPTGFLTDQNGNNIANPGLINAFQGNGLTGYNLQFTEGVNGLIFHDIHFNLTLPNGPAFVVTGAKLNLNISSPNGAINVIPEPTTFALIGIGLVGIGYRAQRSRKAA